MTTFQSPLRVGSGSAKDNYIQPLTNTGATATGATGTGCDLGSVNLEQRAIISGVGAAALTQTVKFSLPANATILNVIADVQTVFNSTANTLSIGYTAGGTDIASGVNVLAATGRITPTFTAAQLLAMNNITTNTSIFATVTGTVSNPTTGLVYVSIRYIVQ